MLEPNEIGRLKVNIRKDGKGEADVGVFVCPDRRGEVHLRRFCEQVCSTQKNRLRKDALQRRCPINGQLTEEKHVCASQEKNITFEGEKNP